MFWPIVIALVAPKPGFPLTIPSIMRGPGLVGGAPRDLDWSSDSSKLYFSWAKADGSPDPRFQNYEVNREGTGLSKAGSRSPIDQIPASANSYGSLRVYSTGGDLVLFDLATSKMRTLSHTREPRLNPVFIKDGKEVAYQEGSDLFSMDLETGETIQLTTLQTPPESSPETQSSPSQTALKSEESQLFKYTGGSGGTGFHRGPRRRGGSGADVRSVIVPKGMAFAGITISPSGKWAAVRFFQVGNGSRPTSVPNYVTRSGYTEEIPSYEKVGDLVEKGALHLVSLDSDQTVELKLPREGGLQSSQWSPDGTKFATWASANDHKDSWLEEFDAAKGSFSEIWGEHDDAWVGGPGQGTLGWLPDSSRLYFESEKTGFAHLYTCAPDGSDLLALTSGDFEVEKVKLDSDRKRFLFVSSEGNPARRHLDAIGFEGGPKEKLADLSADEESAYALSPDGKTLAVVRSTSNRPPELFVNGVQVTTTPTKEWLSGPWSIPPIVSITARDGAKVAGHIYGIDHFHRGGPAVIFVHGAGYLQNVYEGWSYYYREYMFHHLLASMGYIVLDLDYRGSAGYGKAWRTGIYRHMGGKDLDDQVDGARWLVKTYGVNPKRIGIYGGSYGGFITLMAMFTAPDVFAAGAALRPVSDWANYNDGYTSEILNLPQNDPEAYKKSSPIYFAEGLKGALLICHGMVDTNVHFQDSVRLTERLIELGKRNWELAPYPTEDHSFVHPESWTDEYRRILELFEKTIGNHRKVF